MKTLVIAAALTLLATVLTLTAHSAEIRVRGHFAQALLEGADARSLFERLRARVDAHGEKRLELVDEKSSFGLRVSCKPSPGEERCLVTFRATAPVATGRETRVSELLAQRLLGELKLEPRRDRGEWFSGFESRDGAFAVLCEEVYTPTDLPIFSSCWLRFGR